jgi:hypothetical protein
MANDGEFMSAVGPAPVRGTKGDGTSDVSKTYLRPRFRNLFSG